MPRETIQVLSIEDNAGDARLIREILREATTLGWDLPQFELTHVTTLVAALAHLDKSDVDVLLSDLDLPDSRADDTFARLRARVPHLPIVVLTGRDDEALARQAVRAGAEDFLFKREMSGSLLAHALLYAIERQRAKAALQAAHDDLERRVQARTAELEQANAQLRQEIAERQRAEAELRANERLLRTILANLPNTYLSIIEKDLTIGFTSGQEFSRQGLDPDSFVGLTLEQVFGECEPIMRERYAQVFAGAEIEFEMYLNNQYQRYNVIPLHDEHDTISRILAVVENITERKQTEEALRESEEWYRAILQTAMDGFLVVDRQGHLLEVNEATCLISGYSERELLSMSIPDLEVSETPAETAARIQDLMTQGGGRFESKHRRKDGRVIDVEISILYLPSQDGRFVSFLRDITERKQVEEALRESEERFRLMTEISSDLIFQLDLEGQITYCSPAVTQVLGFAPTEVIGTHLARYFPADQLAQALANFERAAAAERVEIVEAVVVGKADTSIVVETCLVPIFREGQVVGVQGTARDITARKQTEEALHESKERYRLLFQNMLSGFALHEIILDDDGIPCDYRFLEVNPAFEVLTGLRGEDLVGRTVRQVMPDIEPYWIETYGRVATTGKPTQIENYSQELDKYYAVTAYAPEPGRFATIFRDVTEHRRMERSLRTTLAEMSALLVAARAVLEHREFANAAPAIFQAGKKAIGAQAGYVALLTEDGTENAILFLDAGGQPCTVDPELPMPIRGLRAEVYHTGQAAYENDFADSEWMQFMPQGHVHLTNVLFAPLVIENRAVGLLGLANKPGGFTPEDTHLATAFGELAAVSLFNSQTLEALERSEARATGYAVELERSNQELELFAYAVSHDLQAPLRAVSGYLSLVAQRCQGQLDAESAEFVQYAADEATRMQEMIQSLLNLSRVSTRGHEFTPTACEQVLTRVLRNLQIAIEDGDAVITHDPLPTVQADEGQLAQVFQNLIDNAIKFRGADPPRVHVSAERQDGAWCFAIQDNGIGLDPAQAERIFQVFQRLHMPDEYPGLGMGLAICKRIVERHGGRIWVESEPGQGATFRFTIGGGSPGQRLPPAT